MRRDADDWPQTRERLRQIVEQQGATTVASEIPVGRTTLFRLLRGDTQAPSLPTQECIERFVDDAELGTRRSRWNG